MSHFYLLNYTLSAIKGYLEANSESKIIETFGTKK